MLPSVQIPLESAQQIVSGETTANQVKCAAPSHLWTIVIMFGQLFWILSVVIFVSSSLIYSPSNKHGWFGHFSLL